MALIGLLLLVVMLTLALVGVYGIFQTLIRWQTPPPGGCPLCRRWNRREED